MMAVPAHPKIYHIVHVDRLASIVADGRLWSHAEVIRRGSGGTNIGMSKLKKRRLTLPLSSVSDLMVGSCVPFYFCPRPPMLYIASRADHTEVDYAGGQESIVHLECDLHAAVSWARAHKRKWAFTLSNAGSNFFEDRCDLAHLRDINWDIVQAKYWSSNRDAKQAEFLMERSFPWSLVARIGIYDRSMTKAVSAAMGDDEHRPPIEIHREWYY